jgi:hypothetical protein
MERLGTIKMIKLIKGTLLLTNCAICVVNVFGMEHSDLPLRLWRGQGIEEWSIRGRIFHEWELHENGTGCVIYRDKRGAGRFIIEGSVPNFVLSRDHLAKIYPSLEIATIHGIQRIDADTFVQSPLKSVTLWSDLEIIGDRAFARCPLSSNLTIPSSVRIIGEDAFYGCDQLQSVRFCGHSLEIIGARAFAQCPLSSELTIPGSVRIIGEGAFCECKRLQAVKFAGNSLEIIGKLAFARCPLYREITIPASVRTIGEQAFYECIWLQAVKFAGNSLEIIDDWAFTRCPLSSKLTIPGSVRIIGMGAFYRCNRLQTVEFAGNSLEFIGDWAFAQCPLSSKFTIPSSVRTIGEGAFYGCNRLQAVEFAGNSLESIEDRAFAQCPLSGTFTIPSSVQTIGEDAFYGCDQLQSVKFAGNSVERIAAGAFHGTNLKIIDLSECTNLIQQLRGRQTIQDFLESIFSFAEGGTGNCTIVLPAVEGKIQVWEAVRGESITWQRYQLPQKTFPTIQSFERLGFHDCIHEWFFFDETQGSASTDLPEDMGRLVTGNFSALFTWIGNGAFRGSTKYIDLSKCTALKIRDEDAFLNRIFASDDKTQCVVHLPPKPPKWMVGPILRGEWGCAGRSWKQLAPGGYYPVDGPQNLTGAERIVFKNPDATRNWGTVRCDDVKAISFDRKTFANCANITIDQTFSAAYPNLRWLLIPDKCGTLEGFENNTNIKSVVVSNLEENGAEGDAKVAPFKNSGLREVSWLPGVEHIRSHFFEDCQLLRSITIPHSVTSIGEAAFRCSGIENIDFEHNELTQIARQTFAGCKKLQLIEIPRSVTRIDPEAFEGSGLQCIAFEPGSSLTTIGPLAFRGCQFSSIVIPSRVSAIGIPAFAESAIEHIEFEPNSQLKIIEPGMLLGCQLKSITIPKSVTTIMDNAFVDTQLEYIAFEPGSKLGTITSGMFRGCQLESITIPASVTEIADDAFANTGLKHVAFEPDSKLKTITPGMFRGCQLESITIPASVTSIEAGTFMNLKRITFEPGSQLRGIPQVCLIVASLSQS